ncbi:MAG: penicillin-binding protein 2 [Armatimonadetes bacterium]|nr:penicillin-binding protein 2 [Armatimonadota bacterium]
MSDVDRRILVLRVALGLILLVFIGRLWELQLTRWVTFAEEAAANRTKVIRTEPPRGLILDRKGRLLAENVTRWRVGVDPAAIPLDDKTRETALARLAAILDCPVPRLRAAIHEALAASAGRPAVLEDVCEQLTFEQVAQIEEHHFDLPGILVVEERRRHYPMKSVAAHVLGYARSITAEQYERLRSIPVPPPIGAFGPEPSLADMLYSRNAITGQAGVEEAYELDNSTNPPLPILAGIPGRTVIEVDARGRAVRVVSSRPPSQGATLWLSIDAAAQAAAEAALDESLRAGHGRSGAVVAVEVNTGQVLVLASRPAFDPNEWVRPLPPERWRVLTNDPRRPLLDKALGGAYPPGSTFKIISAIAAFEALSIPPSRTFVCGGRITVGPKHSPFRCWRRPGHGPVDFWRGLAESCDVYFYELVRRAGLNAETLAYWARSFGLGAKTGIGLTGEVAGLVPDPDWKRLVVHDRWRLGDTLNMVIGQGYLTVTPLQMAMATAAVANGGRLYKPQIVSRIDWPDWMERQPTFAQPEVVSRIPVSPKTLELVRRAMRLAVASPQGTGRALASFPIPAAGKTGSAEHIPKQPTHAWFVCFAPYDAPRYAVAVFVERGGHGGSVAAPIARKVLAALFGIRDVAAGGPAQSD